MLMFNITQKRLIDDWLIDWSLPSRLSYDNEEDVVCKSKPYNCVSRRSVFLAITKRCLIDFTGWKHIVFSTIQTIYQRTVAKYNRDRKVVNLLYFRFFYQ